MSSLIKKTINGNQYYYIVDSKRVNGKPTHVNQIYLGSVNDVLSKLKESAGVVSPIYSEVLEFGACAALYDIAKRLNVIELIDELAGKRNQGISVGIYLLLIAINRAVAPASKSQLEDWYVKTILSKLISCKKNQLNSKRFWDHMNYWTDEKMETFEIKFTKLLIERYKFSTKCLVYDATNFFTYIDTMNEKSKIARRGHSKEKRNDLRIVGLSLLVSSDEEIPLFYEVYEGNKPDVKQFGVVVEKLKEKYKNTFGQDAEITMVFDRGNNSQDNIELLGCGEFPFQFVGGLRQSQCTELFKIAKSKYSILKSDEFKGTSAYRTKMTLYGKEMTIVITNNPELHRGQLQGILLIREKCKNELIELQERLKKWETGEFKKGKAPTNKSCNKNVKDILKGQYMKSLFVIEWNFTGKYPSFQFTISESVLKQLEETVLGKTALFTNNEEWSNEQIVHAYRSAWRVESVFRRMKNTDHLTVRPMWHWTDQKIKVHIFCCVLALRLCYLLKKELKSNGISLSIDQILNLLGNKQQLIHYYQKKRGLFESYSMTKCDELTEKIINQLNLSQYQLKLGKNS